MHITVPANQNKIHPEPMLARAASIVLVLLEPRQLKTTSVGPGFYIRSSSSSQLRSSEFKFSFKSVTTAADTLVVHFCLHVWATILFWKLTLKVTFDFIFTLSFLFNSTLQVFFEVA